MTLGPLNTEMIFNDVVLKWSGKSSPLWKSFPNNSATASTVTSICGLSSKHSRFGRCFLDSSVIHFWSHSFTVLRCMKWSSFTDFKGRESEKNLSPKTCAWPNRLWHLAQLDLVSQIGISPACWAYHYSTCQLLTDSSSQSCWETNETGCLFEDRLAWNWLQIPFGSILELLP